METQRQMVSYEDTEEADGLEEYYGKIEDEMPPQESKSVTETPQDLEDGDYSDLKENRKDRDKKHSRSHHRSRNHKKLKNHDHSDDQEQKPSKKAKKEEQVLQDQTVQKNSPKLGEPLIGEDGEILEDGEIADDQEGALKDDGMCSDSDTVRTHWMFCHTMLKPANTCHKNLMCCYTKTLHHVAYSKHVFKVYLLITTLITTSSLLHI